MSDKLHLSEEFKALLRDFIREEVRKVMKEPIIDLAKLLMSESGDKSGN
jgi:hypothetical protein